MPRTSEQWFWVIMFTAILIGAAGGWAYLAHRVIEHARARRHVDLDQRLRDAYWDDHLEIRDAYAPHVDELLAAGDRELEASGIERLVYDRGAVIDHDKKTIELVGNDGLWWLDWRDDDETGPERVVTDIEFTTDYATPSTPGEPDEVDRG